MQDFTFQQFDSASICVTGYRGDEAEVRIPDSFWGMPVCILADGLFSGHSEIVSVHIPDTVTEMGEFLFDGCSQLRRIRLPSSLEHLWGRSFVRSGLEELILPDRLTTLPPFACEDCVYLQKVVCGSGMKRILNGAFAGCSSLTELIHGPNVEISPTAFQAARA